MSMRMMVNLDREFSNREINRLADEVYGTREETAPSGP